MNGKVTSSRRTSGSDDQNNIDMMANRMQIRHAMLVDAYRHVVSDSTVLLLGAENGRWCYAYAAAGALRVVGVERNADLVERFGRLPDVGLRERIELRCNDTLSELEEEARCTRQHDIVVLLDVLEGVSELHHLFGLVARLEPRMVLVDDLFANTEEPVLLMQNGARKVGAPQSPHRLLPSLGAVALAARESGFDLNWLDWSAIDPADRIGLSDYYQTGPRRRASCMMTLADDG